MIDWPTRQEPPDGGLRAGGHRSGTRRTGSLRIVVYDRRGHSSSMGHSAAMANPATPAIARAARRTVRGAGTPVALRSNDPLTNLLTIKLNVMLNRDMQ